MEKTEYGLELTNNSKASWAFSMPRRLTCIGATDVCWRLCYGNGIRFQTDGQRSKRQRNYETVEFLLDAGGPEMLAQNLIMLADTVRPVDWLAAEITGSKTAIPWSLRIHDTGDFHEARYVQAWRLAVSQRPQCSFWFYTRSFIQPDVFEALCELAAEPNCQGWLSLDSDNYDEGILAYCQAPSVWKLALLQDNGEGLPDALLSALTREVSQGQVVNFPYHHGGRHVKPVKEQLLFNCPAVLGIYKLQGSARKARPCQECRFCLPA